MRILSSMLVPALALALTGCGAKSHGEGPVTDAWMRLSPIEGNPAAGYFTIKGGEEDNRLLSITSPKVASIEFHDMSMKDGMMEMKRIDDGIAIPAHGTVSFSPAGMHAMMFGIASEVKPGRKILLTFRFAKGEPANVEALVKGVGEDDSGHGVH